jgi:hypothetical protein
MSPPRLKGARPQVPGGFDLFAETAQTKRAADASRSVCSRQSAIEQNSSHDQAEDDRREQ